MFVRYFWTYRLFLLFLFLFTFGYQIYNNREQSFVQHDSTIIPLEINKTEFYSIYKSRFNERLFRLGRRFSHINIDLLLSIQTSSIQTITYYCANNCGGWGDRLRGITSTYILSVLLQRRFIIDMQYPCELSNFLIPNLIDWSPRKTESINSLKMISMNSKYQNELYSNISSVNLKELWSSYDNILLTTNSDYITPILKNRFFQSIISELHIRSNESTQQDLFPLIFELLFKPTSLISDELDALLQQTPKQSIICMHIRIGQNPSIPKDAKLPYRESLVPDMTEFLDRNLSHLHSSIFVTSDSIASVQYFQKHFGSKRILNIDGPIIHIDRYNRKTQSNEIIFRGFLKVIADFYFLGECDVILMPRSGFSHWANRRRKNEYSNLYIYCRGLYRVTNQKWRRPHAVC